MRSDAAFKKTVRKSCNLATEDITDRARVALRAMSIGCDVFAQFLESARGQCDLLSNTFTGETEVQRIAMWKMIKKHHTNSCYQI